MNKPPKHIIQFFRWFCRPDYVDDIEGDLLERYEAIAQNNTPLKANIFFLQEVLALMRLSIITQLRDRRNFNLFDMFKNYIKSAFRNLIKHKGFTAINIFGLSSSMAIAMLIMIFIIDQGRSDEHNPTATDTYRVVTKYHNIAENKDQILATSPHSLGQNIAMNVGGVKEAAHLVKFSQPINIADNEFGLNGLYVTPNFLSFFQFDLEEGNRWQALQEQNGLVLSIEMAEKLFGTDSPIDKIVQVGEDNYKITGLIDLSKYQTHVAFDALLPIASFERKEQNQEALTNWEMGLEIFYNYFQLEANANSENLSAYISSMDMDLDEEKAQLYQFDLQRMDQINLGSVVRNEVGITTPSLVAYFFGVLGIVLILSASFNYMNLAIAKGLKRAKEVGVRKVLGGGKRHVIGQFLVEAQIVTFLSLTIAFLLLQVMVPAFNQLKILRDINGAIFMDFNANLNVYLSFIIFSVVLGIISGLYPALYLSSFRPLQVLKGLKNTSKRHSFRFRKFLVFFQYAFSIVFIITTVILYQQAKIFINNDYGFDHQNILNIQMRKSVPYAPFRTELLRRKEIAGVSAVSNVPVISFFEEVEVIDRVTSKENIQSSIVSIDPYTIDNLGLELIAGRNFSSSLGDDTKNTLIINEKALTALGYNKPEDILDGRIELNAKTKTGEESAVKATVIGVIKDFDYQFIFKESGPLLMQYEPAFLSTINVKLADVTPNEGAAIVESVWKEFEANQRMEYDTFSYGLADINDEFVELVNIVGIVAFFTIIIACLGQVSMVIHHLQLKVKEIGIRKVLGSSGNGLIFGLGKGFLTVIVASIVLATPLAVFINVAWTSKLYKAPEVSFTNISLGVGLVLILALGTIFYFIKRAVEANPVESLKYE